MKNITLINSTANLQVCGFKYMFVQLGDRGDRDSGIFRLNFAAVIF
jgi:hypothetical protein